MAFRGIQYLNKDELLTAADYFGVEVKEDATNQEIVAALTEEGVDNDLYKREFLNEESTSDVVKSTDLKPKAEEQEITKEDLEDVVVPEEDFKTESKYLIKMTRNNPLFQFGKYKFTQERPFVIMPASDAERIMTQEEGFRQAMPSEVEDFYS